MMRLRWMLRRTTARSPKGVYVSRFGLSVGYWPCLRAPFVQLSLGSRHFELWYGLPSNHKHTGGNT